jgi:hypothetical protein
MIRWLLWGRQYGKTYQTIKWFLEDPENRVIISADEQTADYTRRQIMRYIGGPIDDVEYVATTRRMLKRSVVSVWSWQRSDITGVRNGVRRKVAVDNLDLVLPALLGADVAMVTATGVSERPPRGLNIDPSSGMAHGFGEDSERTQQQMEAEEQ